MLSLFDRDGQTLLLENDDYPPTTQDGSSRIVWQAATNGRYYVRITNKWGLTGQRTDYDLRIDRPTPSTTALLPIVMRSFEQSD